MVAAAFNIEAVLRGVLCFEEGTEETKAHFVSEHFGLTSFVVVEPVDLRVRREDATGDEVSKIADKFGSTGDGRSIRVVGALLGDKLVALLVLGLAIKDRGGVGLV